MRIVNLTGHRLVLGTDESHLVGYSSRGHVRIDTRYDEVDRVRLENENGHSTGIDLPLLNLVLNGGVHSLPDPHEGRLYVVSGLVAARVRRPDVVAPALQHKEGGRTQYARALLQYP